MTGIMTFNKQVQLDACAKINLFLDVAGRRPDGYHLLTGLMQSVSLADTVTLSITPSDKDRICLTCSDGNLPTDRSNLAFRAAEVFLVRLHRDKYEVPAARIDIHITKRIPYPAGLAGGSADAAAVLRGLNLLSGFPLSTDELEEAGSTLGADIPFCIRGGTCRTEGVGNVLTSYHPMPDCDILIACAGEGISTPSAYRKLDEAFDNFEQDSYKPHTEQLKEMITALDNDDLPGIGAYMFNLFESVILPEHATAAKLRRILSVSGALGAIMSGSGPSVFGLFPRNNAGAAYDILRAGGIPAWICHPTKENLQT